MELIECLIGKVIFSSIKEKILIKEDIGVNENIQIPINCLMDLDNIFDFLKVNLENNCFDKFYKYMNSYIKSDLFFNDLVKELAICKKVKPLDVSNWYYSNYKKNFKKDVGNKIKYISDILDNERRNNDERLYKGNESNLKWT